MNEKKWMRYKEEDDEEEEQVEEGTDDDLPDTKRGEGGWEIQFECKTSVSHLSTSRGVD